MDKRLIAGRFAKARDTYEAQAEAQRLIAGHMASLLRRAFPKGEGERVKKLAEIGCGTGIYSRMLLQGFRPERLWLNDLCPEMADRLEGVMRDGAGRVSFTPGDAERIRLPEECDAVTSCSTFQWFADLPAFLHRCSRSLRPGGILAFSTFGPENLREIRRLTGHGLPYPDTASLRRMLEADYTLLHLGEDILSLPFATPRHVLVHLRQTGVTGTGKHGWTRGRLEAFCEAYVRQFPAADGGGVTLTYHPVYVVAQKPGDGKDNVTHY